MTNAQLLPALRYDVNLHLGPVDPDVDADMEPGPPTFGWQGVFVIVDPGAGAPERVADYRVFVHEADDAGAVTDTLLRLAPVRIELATDCIVVTGHLAEPVGDGTYAATQRRAQIVARPAVGGSAVD